jgi:hypothetical protein
MTHLRIRIDELLLDGATHLDQAQFVQAIRQALAQQLATQGLPPAVTVPRTRGEVDGFTAESVAGQITQTIYGGQK